MYFYLCIEGMDTVKWFPDMFKKMDKTKWMILGLSGILLLVIAIPTERDSGAKDLAALEQEETDSSSQDRFIRTYKKQLADDLEQALACMDGVGKVRVMITFQDSGEAVVEKDVMQSSSGQAGSQTGSQYQESTVYQEENGREPYVSQQKLPAVEGVLVIAQGGGDSGVKRDISDAVQALFPVEVHKIKIVKMKE